MTDPSTNQKVVVEMDRKIAGTAEFWLDADAGECFEDAQEAKDRAEDHMLQCRGEELGEAADAIRAALSAQDVQEEKACARCDGNREIHVDYERDPEGSPALTQEDGKLLTDAARVLCEVTEGPDPHYDSLINGLHNLSKRLFSGEDGERFFAHCNACGYSEDDGVSSCTNCGGQMQRLPIADLGKVVLAWAAAQVLRQNPTQQPAQGVEDPPCACGYPWSRHGRDGACPDPRVAEAALDAQGMGDGEKERYRDDIALCIEAAEPIIRSEEREALREKLELVAEELEKRAESKERHAQHCGMVGNTTAYCEMWAARHALRDAAQHLRDHLPEGDRE